MKTEFQPGDKIFHKANPRVFWIIERIDNDEASCSNLNDKLEKITNIFSLISIEKYKFQPTITFSPKRNNHY
jgi:hypothetical protein